MYGTVRYRISVGTGSSTIVYDRTVRYRTVRIHERTTKLDDRTVRKSTSTGIVIREYRTVLLVLPVGTY